MTQVGGAQPMFLSCWEAPPPWANAHQTGILWLATGMMCNAKEGKPAVWLSRCLFSLKRQQYKTAVELWQHGDLSHCDVFLKI